MISRSFTHKQCPRHLHSGRYGCGPVMATTPLWHVMLTWQPHHGVVRETRRLGLGCHVTRHATPRRPMNAGHLASPTAHDGSPPRPTPRGSLARTPGLACPDPAHSCPARPTPCDLNMHQHPLRHCQHAVPCYMQVSAAALLQACPTTDTLPGPDRKSTRLNSSHSDLSRMPSSA